MNAVRRLAAAAVAACLVALPQALPAAVQRPLALADLRALVGVSDPQIAPDGKTIAVTLRRADYDADKYRTEIVVVDVASRAARPLTNERDDASRARWSPRGDRIAFVATPANGDEKAQPQVFVADLRGGDPVRVTDAKKGVSDFAWRPDGGEIAFTTTDEAPNAKAIADHDDGFMVGDNAWNVRAEPLPHHLWTVAARGGTAHRITSGSWSAEGPIAYTPDGRSVLFERAPDAFTGHYRARTLSRVDLASHAVRTFIPVRGAGNVVYSHDRKHVLFAIEDPHSASQNDLALANADGGNVRIVSKNLDRNVQFGAFFPNDADILTGAADETHSRLFVLEKNGSVTTIGRGLDTSGSATVANDGTIAVAASTNDHPAELYVFRRRPQVRLPDTLLGAPVRLTSYNDGIARHAMGASRTITWKGAGGFTDDGVLTEPVNYRKGTKAPLVMLIHGGPTATSTLGFSGLVQLMAARGWFVFQPNYRGSDNLGAAFAQATIPHITSAPGQDCMDGLAAVLKLGVVDEKRIGVTGWSEGGLMTSWLITHDTRWKSAMSGAAVNDWLAYGTLTDARDFTNVFISPKSPWTDEKLRAFYAAESPLTYASRVKTPTLIMSDAGDQRVPEPLAYEFYHEIRATGTPVKLVIFNANGHNPTDPVRNEDRTRRWVQWFVDTL